MREKIDEPDPILKENTVFIENKRREEIYYKPVKKMLTIRGKVLLNFFRIPEVGVLTST